MIRVEFAVPPPPQCVVEDLQDELFEALFEVAGSSGDPEIFELKVVFVSCEQTPESRRGLDFRSLRNERLRLFKYFLETRKV